jgi:hypothetical protein
VQTVPGDFSARSCLEEYAEVVLLLPELLQRHRPPALLRQKVVLHAVRAAWGERHELVNIFAKKSGEKMSKKRRKLRINGKKRRINGEKRRKGRQKGEKVAKNGNKRRMVKIWATFFHKMHKK